MTPLFIVGAPRSGTTLVRTLMRGFEQVYLPPDEFQILPRFVREAEDAISNGSGPDQLVTLVETSVFAEHMRRRGIWPGQDHLTQVFQNCSPAEAFEALVLAVASQEEALPVQFWGDKTPETVFQLDLVKRLWPSAKILHVVRDPRSTVLSMHRAWGRSILRSSVIWRDAETAADRFSQTSGAQYQRLSFEALTADPRSEMDRIGSWLGLEFNHNSLASVSSEERWGRASGETGVQHRKADWENALRPSQIKQIEEICLAEMRQAGYEPTLATQQRNPPATLLKLTKVGDAFRVLKSYANERGWRSAIRYKISQWHNK